MPLLAGKRAIVTGASRGIGRAIATRLAAEGAAVALNYAQSASEAEWLARETGGIPIRADMADPEQVRRLFEQAEAKLGGIDILVNNAGVALFGPMAEFSLEDFERTFAVNARGVFVAMQEAARRMKDGGRIVGISTGATVGGTAGGAAYCGSKAAVEQFTRALAREIGARGITVNCVSPGFTDTDMLRQFPQLMASAPAMSALGRLGAPGDIADVVVFLCSDAGRWITGQNLQAGGGVSMV